MTEVSLLVSNKQLLKIQSDSEVLIVIGIGGSYLGARAAIDFLNNSFVNLQSKEKRKTPQILYAGNSISSNYLADLVEYVQDKDFSVNVISKSGTTTEPAIAFRVFKELLVKKYGQEEANKRIYATTDRQKGAVKVEADANGWAKHLLFLMSVGGRFTVLTASWALANRCFRCRHQSPYGGCQRCT